MICLCSFRPKKKCWKDGNPDEHVSRDVFRSGKIFSCWLLLIYICFEMYFEKSDLTTNPGLYVRMHACTHSSAVLRIISDECTSLISKNLFFSVNPLMMPRFTFFLSSSYDNCRCCINWKRRLISGQTHTKREQNDSCSDHHHHHHHQYLKVVPPALLLC